MKSAILGVLLAAFAIPCAALAELEDGIRLQERKDYGKAAVAFQKAALKGSGEARRRLGLLYYHGQGVKQDNAKAVALFEMAAEGGDIESASDLGMMYEFGMGVTLDESLAVKWYARAAELGDPGSQYRASEMYYKGRGVARDRIEAAKWWTLAMAQGGDFARSIRTGVDSAEAKLTAEELAEGRRRAADWTTARDTNK